MGTGKENVSGSRDKLGASHSQSAPRRADFFMGQSMFRPDAHPTERTLDQDFAVRNLQKDGVQGLVIVPPNNFIGDDGEGTVDGVHYNDIGSSGRPNPCFPSSQGSWERRRRRKVTVKSLTPALRGDFPPVNNPRGGTATR